MTKLISETQQEEIVKMADTNDHREALVAYGADHYAQGIKKGLTLAFGVWATCFAIGYAIGMVKFVRGKKV